MMNQLVMVDPVLAAADAVQQQLDLPAPAADGRYNTLNEHGAMTQTVGEIESKFIEIAARPTAKVLEIGTAYGNICLEALDAGACDYVANDVDRRHLMILARRVADQMPHKLAAITLAVGSFPNDQTLLEHIPENSFDAILAAKVLHFLAEHEVRIVFNLFHRLLKPGGTLFASMSTPYLGFIKQKFREEMIQKIANFVEKSDEELILPGFIERTREIVDPEIMCEHDMDAIALTRGHSFVFDKCVVDYLLAKERFEVETCAYRSSLVDPWKLDGREILVVIAKKNSVS